MADQHVQDCDPGYTCVECGGCECGAVPSTCTGPLCVSVDAYEQQMSEEGRTWEDSPYA